MLRTTVVGAAAIVSAALLAGCSGSANVSSPTGEEAVMGAPVANPQTQQPSTYEGQTAYRSQSAIREVPAQQGQYQGQYQGGQQAAYQQSNLRLQGGYQGNLQIQPQINTSTGDLRLVNNSDQDVRNIHVTANDNYTAHIDRIPAHGSVILNRNDFSGPTGSLATSDSAVRNIKLDVNGQMLTYTNMQQP